MAKSDSAEPENKGTRENPTPKSLQCSISIVLPSSAFPEPQRRETVQNIFCPCLRLSKLHIRNLKDHLTGRLLSPWQDEGPSRVGWLNIHDVELRRRQSDQERPRMKQKSLQFRSIHPKG